MLSTDFELIPKISGYSYIANIGYPDRLCSCIFTSGCNFKCPMCINNKLLNNNLQEVNLAAILETLLLRKEKCIVVSGGEPFINKNIHKLFQLIKEYGFECGVCTNGFYSNELMYCIRKNLLDYVVLDIKTELDEQKYSKVCGTDINYYDLLRLRISINYLKEKMINKHEFRTTMCSKFVSEEDIINIAKFYVKDSLYVLQPFTTHQLLDVSLRQENNLFSYDKVVRICKKINKIVQKCIVRED